MSVVFDLTVVGPELFDAVVNMEKSPAYAAFKEEIEKILADFNKSGKYWEPSTVDVKTLVENSSDAIRNMQKAFLLWTIKEDAESAGSEFNYETFMKLFMKGQESQLIFLNEGKKSVAAKDVAGIKAKFLRAINTTPDLFNSIKEFFSGYVYGYFFNYLSEQKIMKQYAEFIVCLAIMSGKITATEAEKQKILPKMAKLLNNDRFKYIGGYVPLNVMLDIVFDRYDTDCLNENEKTQLKATLKKYIIEHYDYNDAEEQFISVDVTSSIMSAINAEYTDIEKFAADLFGKTYDGVRTFLDTDKDDIGDYTLNRLTSIINSKCSSDYDEYYTSSREPIINFGLGAGNKGYKYPLVFKRGNKFMCADMYVQFIYPVLDSEIYVEIDSSDIPLKEFPFAVDALRSNIIRDIAGIPSSSYTIRADKKVIYDEICKIDSTRKLAETDKKMAKLERILVVVSSNLDSESYKDLLTENVFNSSLYEEYIRFRMDRLFNIGMKSLDTKKKLLDELNKIS